MKDAKTYGICSIPVILHNIQANLTAYCAFTRNGSICIFISQYKSCTKDQDEGWQELQHEEGFTAC
jgi:hypothetical protein